MDSKRWTRLSRAAMPSSLSTGWQHRRTSWMQQPKGLAKAGSSPTDSVHRSSYDPLTRSTTTQTT